MSYQIRFKADGTPHIVDAGDEDGLPTKLDVANKNLRIMESRYREAAEAFERAHEDLIKAHKLIADSK